MGDISTQFTQLPKNLRLRIWAATIEPRVLRVGIGAKAKTAVADWSPLGNPVGLRVCKESRAFMLERYTLTVPIYYYHQKSELRFAKRYIDPEADVVFIDPNFESESASNWGQINSDFNQLMPHLKVVEAADDLGGRLRTKVAVRRMAVPRRWWLFTWSQSDLRLSANRYFTDLREIIILADSCDEKHEDLMEPSGALLPARAQECLQDMGWNVQVEGQVLTVTTLNHSACTRIHGETMASFDRMEIPPVASSSKDTFFIKAPGVEYEDRSCMPGFDRRPPRNKLRRAPPQIR